MLYYAGGSVLVLEVCYKENSFLFSSLNLFVPFCVFMVLWEMELSKTLKEPF